MGIRRDRSKTMQNRNRMYEKIFLSVSSLAALFVLTEIVMNSFGRSLCVTEGCKMTAQAARFGEMSIYLLGFAAFFSFAALSLLNRTVRTPLIERLINLMLIAALAGEGFFVGYLAFRIHTACVFCLTVFGFMVTLGIVRILAGERDIIAGFVTLAVIFLMQYLVLPAGVPVHLPTNERLILFYSKDCKHCVDVMKELEEKKISVAHVPVQEFVGFLKDMGIEHIPTLMVNDPYQKVFLTGEDAIGRYLLSCTGTKTPPANRAQGATVLRKKGQPASEATATANTFDVFNQAGLLTSPSQSAANDGMCREDEICK